MMDFLNIANQRQSCRRYDPTREVESDKLDAVLEAARLAPSACNGQPYHITVVTGERAKAVAKATAGPRLNGFAVDAPLLLVITEQPYTKTAALGAKISKNDYRSMDIGILSAYITAQAACEGLGSCILGWFDNKAVCKACGIDGTVRLIITLGYAKADDELRPKKRLPIEDLVSYAPSSKE